MDRGLMIALCLCLGSGPVHAANLSRSVPSGVTVEMHSYRSWGRNCEGNGGTVKLLSKPLHGKLTTRTVDSRIGINRFALGGKTNCAGRPIKAFEVRYRSDRGYRGPDSFTIEMVTGNGQRDVDTYTVTVE